MDPTFTVFTLSSLAEETFLRISFPDVEIVGQTETMTVSAREYLLTPRKRAGNGSARSLVSTPSSVPSEARDEEEVEAASHSGRRPSSGTIASTQSGRLSRSSRGDFRNAITQAFTRLFNSFTALKDQPEKEQTVVRFVHEANLGEEEARGDDDPDVVLITKEEAERLLSDSGPSGNNIFRGRCVMVLDSEGVNGKVDSMTPIAVRFIGSSRAPGDTPITPLLVSLASKLSCLDCVGYELFNCASVDLLGSPGFTPERFGQFKRYVALMREMTAVGLMGTL